MRPTDGASKPRRARRKSPELDAAVKRLAGTVDRKVARPLAKAEAPKPVSRPELNRAVKRVAVQGEREVAAPLKRAKRTPAQKAFDSVEERVARPLARMEQPIQEGRSNLEDLKWTAGLAWDAATHFPKNAVDLVAGAPAGIYTLGKTAVTDPSRVPGMLAQPYKDFAHDPEKFVRERPAELFAMAAPPAKAGSVGVGSAARRAGKQTLNAKPKVLPGTAHKVESLKPRGVVGNALATAKENRAVKAADGKPLVLSTKASPFRVSELDKSVDEFAAAARKTAQRHADSAAKDAKRRFENLPRDERGKKIDEHVRTARKTSIKANIERDLANEFGVNVRVRADKSKPVSAPGNAPAGPVYATKEVAQAAAKRAGYKDAHVLQVGDGFAAIPAPVWKRWQNHEVVGSSPAALAITLRASAGALSKVNLPFSGSYHAGNTIEAGVRAGLSGARPSDALLARRVLREMDPKIAARLKDHAVPSGSSALQRQHTESMAQQIANAPHFKNDRFGALVDSWENAKRANLPGTKRASLKTVGKAYDAAAEKAFAGSSKLVENPAQMAMLGRHIRKNVLDKKTTNLRKVSQKQVEEIARLFERSPSQRALAGREVRKEFGNYNTFSPFQREALTHWARFAPWAINAAKYPAQLHKHPVGEAVAYNSSMATRDKKRLPSDLPWWMATTIPSKGGAVNLGKYTPFGFWPGAIEAPGQSLGRLLLPQIGPVLDWRSGQNYKGKPSKHPTPEMLFNLAESLTPVAPTIDRATGVGDKYVRGLDTPDALTTQRALDTLLRQAWPFTPMKNTTPKKKRKAKRKAQNRSGDILGGGSSSGSGDILN